MILEAAGRSAVRVHWRMTSARNLTLMLAALSSLGPFSIDTYLPAFQAIATDLGASDLQVQQSLTAYLLPYGIMNLWHGAFSDSVGRKGTILWCLALFLAASLGAATAGSIEALWAWRALQGVAGGAGMIIGRAIIRDVYQGPQAQRAISQVMMIFVIAPVIAPIIGGFVSAHFGWRAVFVFLAAYAGAVLLLAWWRLPETLAPEHRQSFSVANLASGYAQIFSLGSFWRLSGALTLFFQGFFLYILAAPAFAMRHLGLSATEFYWVFVPSVLGTMTGAALSARTAGRIGPDSIIGRGAAVMAIAAIVNAALNLGGIPILPLAVMHLFFYNIGLGLVVAAMQVKLLDLVPVRRGMVASCHASLQSLGNALTAALIVPLLWGSTLLLSLGMLGYLAGGGLLYLMSRRLDRP